MVEGHVALALVVPLVGAGRTLVVVLVVDLGTEAGVHPADDIVGEETGGCIPLLERQVEHLSIRPHGVEQAPVVYPFVQIVHIVGEVEGAAPFRVLVDHGPNGFLHERHQPAFQERPSRRRGNLRRFDLDQPGDSHLP